MTSQPGVKKITRRGFLVKTGWVAAGITVLGAVSFPTVRANLPTVPTTNNPEPDDGMAWIQVLPGGRIRFFCPRMEMGQGAVLGLSQIVAEELNIDQSEIECLLPSTDQTPPFKMTVGSESILEFFNPVSLAGARLREILRDLAAEKAGIKGDQIKDARGGFILPDGSRLGYGDLVPSAPLVVSPQDWTGQEKQAPRYAQNRQGGFAAIGKTWKPQDLEAIVTGKAVYSRDTVVPGMMFAQVLRAPAFGARLKKIDDSAAKAMAGISVVVGDEGNNFAGAVNFIAVVAADPFLLPEAIEALQVEWEIPDAVNQDQLEKTLDVERLRAGDDFEHIVDEAGNASRGRSDAKFQTTARYDTPFAAHAAIEPRASVVSVTDEKIEVWCASQDPFYIRGRVAAVVGRSVDEVVVHSHRIGGGFGGRVLCQASEEAAILSAAVGAPVRVQWDRKSEFQNNYLQPAFSHHINAGVKADGKISHWQHDFVSSPIIFGQIPKNVAWAMDKVVADFGTSRGSKPPYQISNRRTRFSDIRTAVSIGAWRGLGAAPNAFAIESMMDELASGAGIDPLELRLNNLPASGSRLADVLRRVAEISGWGQSVAKDQGRGLACSVYKGDTPVAVVAEVQVDRAAEKIRVTKVWCAQDCGLVLNPHQVENQVMGNIVWGTSMAMKEQITIEDGQVQEENFDAYEILRHDETPKIVVDLIEPAGARPVGVGESALPAVPAAIANAVFAATGKRVRRLPISYENVVT